MSAPNLLQSFKLTNYISYSTCAKVSTIATTILALFRVPRESRVSIENRERGARTLQQCPNLTCRYCWDCLHTHSLTHISPSLLPKTRFSWGDEARIVEDYEGRAVIVDSLSRTAVTFLGSEMERVDAYVVATRDALRGYLAGGNRTLTVDDPATVTAGIQRRKEKEARVPMRTEDDQGKGVDDEEGYYTDILDRDYGDWGDISTTGVHVSSQEVQGVLLLSDVYGPFTEHTIALADKITFECQPLVVFVTDVFRDDP